MLWLVCFNFAGMPSPLPLYTCAHFHHFQCLVVNSHTTCCHVLSAFSALFFCMDICNHHLDSRYSSIPLHVITLHFNTKPILLSSAFVEIVTFSHCRNDTAVTACLPIKIYKLDVSKFHF